MLLGLSHALCFLQGFGTPLGFLSSGSNLEKECPAATSDYLQCDPGLTELCLVSGAKKATTPFA